MRLSHKSHKGANHLHIVNSKNDIVDLLTQTSMGDEKHAVFLIAASAKRQSGDSGHSRELP